MPPASPEPRYELYYWPIPFRGSFISYLFAYCDAPLAEEQSIDGTRELMGQSPGAQAVPFMGPPVLRDRKKDRSLSQMPAIVLYVARELDLVPDDPFDMAMCLKVLMDCNDVLMEITRYNGACMWTREEWVPFRTQRLPRWMQIFEESLKRGAIGQEPVSFADIGVLALFGNMTRCLPELEADLLEHAPGIHSLCSRIAAQGSLARHISGHEQHFGKLYCGGQIEQSIRDMLEIDAKT